MAERPVIHDHGAALAALDEWLGHLDERKALSNTYANVARLDEIDEWFLTHLTMMQQIGTALHGDAWSRSNISKYANSTAMSGPWVGTRDAVVMMRGTLVTQGRTAAMFSRPGPQLAAAGLHPWVWTAARDLWANGHHREAVANAATSVETNFRSKLGRFDISGAPLARQAFSLAPATVDQPRLRLVDGPDAPDDQRWKSAHQGAMDFGAGVFEGIRNWAAHVVEEADEQVALEYLAALSVLARWVDGARRATA